MRVVTALDSNQIAPGRKGSAYMLVPVGIFIIAFALGSFVCASALPKLGASRVGRISYLVVCGLLGMVAALIAVHVYEIVRQSDAASSLGAGNEKPDVIANGLMAMLRDLGPVLGLAGAVYLLAPTAEDEEEQADEVALQIG